MSCLENGGEDEAAESAPVVCGTSIVERSSLRGRIVAAQGLFHSAIFRTRESAHARGKS